MVEGEAQPNPIMIICRDVELVALNLLQHAVDVLVIMILGNFI
jgi:hypothetical protein